MAFAEEQPLLRPALEDLEDGGVRHTEVILDFDPEGDDENPREWPTAFKWAIVLLLACMAFTVTFTCISVVPVAGTIADDLDHGSGSSPATALLVTIWELGEAAGPLLIAPLSEVFGRYPVMNAANVLFIAATLLAAISQSTPMFIAARALTGLAVASNVLNPAILGDMFESDERGSAMSLIMLAPLIGGAVGPAISGAIAQTLGWRQVLFIAAGLATACEILFLTCFRETYKMAILRRRAAKMRLEAGDGADSKHDSHHTEHRNLNKLLHSITRPFAVLFGSSVLLLMSLFGSVLFSYFYTMSVTLPDILQDVYGFTPAQTGLAFFSFSIGSFCSVIVCNRLLDKIFIQLRGDSKANGKPEYRLPLAIIGAFTMPIAVFAYGWTAELALPVPLLLLSVAFLGFTLMLATVPLSAYVVDACGLYSASAMTGIIVTRCLMGTFLPLATGPLKENFGYGWGFTVLAALSLALAPIPAFVMKYGEAWRQSSEYTKA
ncbi:major facilitator superfamily transporter [Plectosphaerella plurivora]|uniref:Major facilitator superfamily transporter n=1 Tax=Plectosphaerella plurivora TaxID=936078 RepID=A0A9P8V4U8_9PEZI|nr:major facilitator superfamily transporter [Plectosphaerella plurivora]